MTNSTGVSDGIRSDSEEDENLLKTAFVRVFSRIRSSVVMFTIALGVVTAVLGATPLVSGAEAGLMGVSGVSLILFGLIALAALRLIGYSG